MMIYSILLNTLPIKQVTIQLGILNIWLFLVIGYGLISLFMVISNKKRGKPIEDPKYHLSCGKKQVFVTGYLPLILLFIVSLFIPIRMVFPFIIGLFLVGLGVLINGLAMKSFTSSIEKLNTGGIYRFSRNPMYVGGIILIIGLNIMGWSASLINVLFIASSLFMIAMFHYTILKEEQFLINKYGQSYQQYLNNIPRYVGLKKTVECNNFCYI